MSPDSKKKTAKPQNGSDDRQQPEGPGISGFLGIVLLAGALFNLPAIMKVPETTADKMMLVIVLAMAAGGGILLLSLRKK